MRVSVPYPQPATVERLRAVVVTALMTAFAFLAAQRVLVDGKLAAAAVGAVVLAVVVIQRPRFTVLVMLVLSAPLFQLMRRTVDFAGLRTDAFEVLAYALVARWLISRGNERRMPSWQFAAPVLLLVAGATVGAVFALTVGASRYLVLGQYKAYLVYLLILPLSALFGTLDEKRRLEMWVVNFCVAASLVVLGAAAIGSSTPTEDPNLPLNTFGVATQVNRIRPSMLWLLFLATLIVVGRAVTYGMSRRMALQLSLFVAVWLFTFNRSSWVALLVCTGLLALFHPGPRRPTRALRTLAVAALVLPLTMIVADRGLLGPTLSEVPRRVESLFRPEVAQEDSLRDRAEEYPVAFRALADSPVLGVGLGRPYGARRPFYSPRLGVIVYEERPFAHNSLLFAYLQTGLLGVAGLVWLAIAARRAAARALRDCPVDIALRIFVGSVALLGYAIQSLTQTSLLHRPSITAAVVAMVLATWPRELDA
ncbi:MAG TPA: O-antigen ligase family protein [Frankiaceae bacterium]|nr:O-antigen ligase family protein [Frankiaceae bacterium]